MLETELQSCSDTHIVALTVVNCNSDDRIQGLLALRLRQYR